MPQYGEEFTIARTPAPGCPACAGKRLHTEADWSFHPEAGTGKVGEPSIKKSREDADGRN